ncbi:hypothetical protein CPB83DRAFT_844933 [Crepidotus variabilis]|uniref:Uncharacterized protein n=1 Tax=Crepidotus variabilis TaxID=179855 RepID=A0A9P6JVI0_9AGAR|nr:hypothetical protein CPB83DRAFT_844933 [Crepidotus variabilis]
MSLARIYRLEFIAASNYHFLSGCALSKRPQLLADHAPPHCVSSGDMQWREGWRGCFWLREKVGAEGSASCFHGRDCGLIASTCAAISTMINIGGFGCSFGLLMNWKG